MKKKTSFKLRYLFLFFLMSCMTAAFSANMLGNTEGYYYILFSLIIVLFTLQTFLYIKSCKYIDLINFTRECEPYKKKAYFYTITYTALNYILFCGLGIITSITILNNLVPEYFIKLFAVLVTINMAYISVQAVYRTYLNMKIVFIDRKYGRTQKTIDELKKIRIPKLLSSKRNVFILRTNLINFYITIGDFENALQLLDMPDSYNIDFKFRLEVYLRTGNYSNAEQIFSAYKNQLMSQANSNSDAQYIQGLSNYVCGDYEESIKWFEKSIESAATYIVFPVYMDLAYSYLAAGNREKAKEYADKAEKLIENSYDRERTDCFFRKYNEEA